MVQARILGKKLRNCGVGDEEGPTELAAARVQDGSARSYVALQRETVR